MAKSNAVFKFQGTLAGLTFVSSVAYGDHIRAKRGTHKDATLNQAMKRSSKKLKEANVPAKIFKDAIEPYRDCLRDGTLWQRLLSCFRKQQKEQGAPDFQALKGLDIHARYPLGRFFEIHPTIRINSKKARLEVDFHYNAPAFKKSKNIDGYKLTVIGIFPDLKKRSAKTVSVASGIIQLKDGITEFHAGLNIPGRAKTCVVCVKIEGCTQQETANTQATQGLRVLAVEQF
jgi:hypothetical protein